MLNRTLYLSRRPSLEFEICVDSTLYARRSASVLNLQTLNSGGVHVKVFGLRISIPVALALNPIPESLGERLSVTSTQ